VAPKYWPEGRAWPPADGDAIQSHTLQARSQGVLYYAMKSGRYVPACEAAQPGAGPMAGPGMDPDGPKTALDEGASTGRKKAGAKAKAGLWAAGGLAVRQWDWSSIIAIVAIDRIDRDDQLIAQLQLLQRWFAATMAVGACAGVVAVQLQLQSQWRPWPPWPWRRP
jgi:hypothetical protein